MLKWLLCVLGLVFPKYNSLDVKAKKFNSRPQDDKQNKCVALSSQSVMRNREDSSLVLPFPVVLCIIYSLSFSSVHSYLSPVPALSSRVSRCEAAFTQNNLFSVNRQASSLCVYFFILSVFFLSLCCESVMGIQSGKRTFCFRAEETMNIIIFFPLPAFFLYLECLLSYVRQIPNELSDICSYSSTDITWICIVVLLQKKYFWVRSVCNYKTEFYVSIRA